VELAYGWDTTRFGPGGAIGGTSLLTNFGVGSIPTQGSDGLYCVICRSGRDQDHQADRRSRFFVRAAAGGVAGQAGFGRRFFLSSFDNLRGFPLGGLAASLGDGYYVGQAELQFPLDVLIPDRACSAGSPGVVGFDFGGVVDSTRAVQNPRRHGYTKLHAALADACVKPDGGPTFSASTWVWDPSSSVFSSPTGSDIAE